MSGFTSGGGIPGYLAEKFSQFFPGSAGAHNDLSNIDGGQADQYFHLTSNDYDYTRGVATLGTAEASKVLTADANLDLTDLRNLSITGAFTADTVAATTVTRGGVDVVTEDLTLTVAGTTNEIDVAGGTQTLAGNRTWTASLSSTVTDLLAYLSGVVPGTATALKALVLDAGKSITGITSITATTVAATTVTRGGVDVVTEDLTLTVAGATNEIDVAGGTQTLAGNRTWTASLSSTVTDLLAYLSGVVPGTATALKALVLDAGKSITGITSLTATTVAATTVTRGGVDVVTEDLTLTVAGTTNEIDVAGGTQTLAGNRTWTASLSSTVTDLLDYLSGVTPGTATASKALIVDISKDIAGINELTAATLTATAITRGGVDVVTEDLTLTVAGTTNEIDVAGGTQTLAGNRTWTASLSSTVTDLLAYLSGVVPGTATALKALIVSAAKDITGINDLSAATLTASGVLTALSLTLGASSVDATELGFLDGSSPGSGIASKVMVLDPSKDIAGINDFGAATLTASSTVTIGAATVDATEFGYLDGTTPGTATASKVLVPDGTNSIDSLNFGNVSLDYLDFDTAAGTPSALQGRMFWFADDRCASTMLGNGVIHNQGQETYLHAVNNTGLAIGDGKVVRVNGAATGKPTIALSKADQVSNISGLIGITTELIDDGDPGLVTFFGLVHGFDTSTYAGGDVLYLSDSTFGGITDVPPTANGTNFIIVVGTVTEVAVNGTILVDIDVDIFGTFAVQNVFVNDSAQITNNLNVGGDVVITGDLTVNGTTTTINTETVQVKDNLIVLNYGETGPGVTAGTAGVQVDRGTETDYLFEFVEAGDTFRIGEIGSTQAVATREDTPNDNGLAFWNASSVLFETASTLAFDGSILTAPAITATGAIAAASMTATGTIQAEQLTSTDDAEIQGTLAVGGSFTPLADAHIKSGASGFAGALSVNNDEFAIEGSGNVGMTILSSAANNGSIAFADADSNFQGALIYLHSIDELSFYTNAVKQAVIDSDGHFEQKGTFGTISVKGASAFQTITTATPTKVTLFTKNGPASNVTVDHTADRITITKSGTYEITGKISFSAVGNSVTWTMDAYVNGSPNADVIPFERRIGTSGDVGTADITGQVALTAGQYLEVFATHDRGSDSDLTVVHGDLEVLYIGE